MSKMRNMKRERIENIFGALLIIAFLTTIVMSQRTVGWQQLGLMLGSLLGLVLVLAAYNRRFL